MNQIFILIILLITAFVGNASLLKETEITEKVILCILNESSDKDYLKSVESIKLDLASNQIFRGVGLIKTIPSEKKIIIYNVMTPPMPLTDEQIKEIQNLFTIKYPMASVHILEGQKAQELLKP